MRFGIDPRARSAVRLGLRSACANKGCEQLLVGLNGLGATGNGGLHELLHAFPRQTIFNTALQLADHFLLHARKVWQTKEFAHLRWGQVDIDADFHARFRTAKCRLLSYSFSPPGGRFVRVLKKYPNRRLYDTEKSEYVTVEDVRQMVLAKQQIKVLDSKTGNDLTRSVLLQIISEQEAMGHEPLLTNKVLEQIIRFYGDNMSSFFSRYMEQSIANFLDMRDQWERRVSDVFNTNPLSFLQQMADQNRRFVTTLLQGVDPSRARKESRKASSKPGAKSAEPADGDD